MIQLFREAQSLQEKLAGRHWRFCFIGGIVVQHWGEPRVTRDLDISIFTGFGAQDPFVDDLLAEFSPRIVDARAFALKHRVLLLSTETGVPIDVALAALPFESEMIDRAVMVEFQPGVSLRVCTADDLFVLKAFADRDQDRADLIGIARRRGAALDWHAIEERLAPLAQAKEEPDLMTGVRRLRKEFGSPETPPKRP